MRLAKSVILSRNKGVLIDGIEFPFWVHEQPTIEAGGSDELTIVNLPVIVDGFVMLDTERRQVIDGELGRGLGDVGKWARRYVRDSFIDAFPWLDLPAEETK